MPAWPQSVIIRAIVVLAVLGAAIMTTTVMVIAQELRSACG